MLSPDDAQPASRSSRNSARIVQCSGEFTSHVSATAASASGIWMPSDVHIVERQCNPQCSLHYPFLIQPDKVLVN